MPSPPAQLPPQLKWHNTLPAHFSSDNQTSKTLATPGRRAEKRQQPSPDAVCLRSWNEGGELHPTVGSSGNIPSPTKRHRTVGRASGSNLTTPTKANAGNNGSSSFESAGSGMQTPPPSGSSMSKKRRAPRGIPSFESPRVSATSPVSSPSKGARYIKSNRTVDSAKIQGSPLRPSTSGSKEAASNELFEGKSNILDADTSIDWSSFDDDGIHTRSIGGPDLFLHSDMAYGDLADPMTFSFNCSNDFDDSSLPSIDPNLIFSSRPTSNASSILGGYTDDTDVLSSSSIANEQPYQHQHNYSRRERASELLRTQRRKEKERQKRLGDESIAHSRGSSMVDSSIHRSLSENTIQPNPSFRAASLDEAVSRQGSVARGRENTTPPPSSRLLQPKTEVKLLISPSGRAKTETKMVYDESDTEPDEANASGNSVDESMESDSSLDEATPRGLGPGGKSYSTIRKPKSVGLSGRGPKLGLFSTAPYSCSSSNPDWSVLEEPSSPVRKPVARSTTRTSGVSQTPHRFPGRSLDECILSSPKLPTPLRSTPGGVQSRPKIISSGTYHGSLRMDSRLQPQMTLDISDESEAETVVDENVNPNPDRAEPGLDDEDQEGNALQALRHAVAKRRGAVSDMTVIRSPARSRLGGSLKRSYRGSRTEQASVIPPAIAKNLFALPPNLAQQPPPPPPPILGPHAPAPAPAALSLQRKTLRRRRVIPDGGYSHPLKKSGSFSTISDPDLHTSSTEEDEAEGSLESDEVRCICGTDSDGGTLMVQCDSCNNWLHLSCTGLNRKALPKTYTCSFCCARLRENFHPQQGTRSTSRIGGGSFRGPSAPSTSLLPALSVNPASSSLSSAPDFPHIKRRMC